MELDNHPFWTAPPEVQQTLIDRCDKAFGEQIRDAYDKTRSVLYCAGDLREVMFPGKYGHWNDRDYSARVRVNFGQVNKYRRRKQSPELPTAEKWLRLLEEEFPSIPTDGIYDAISIDFAVARWAHEEGPTPIRGVRKTRTPQKALDIDGVDQAKVAVAYLLTKPGPVHDLWLYQLERHHSDWNASADDPDCDRFFVEMLIHAERLFGTSASKTWFHAAAHSLLSIDLDSPSEAQKLRNLVRAAWNGPDHRIGIAPESLIARLSGEDWSHSVTLFVAHQIVFDS